MPGKIFLLKEKEQLVEMNEADYEKENILQELISAYPDLLLGEQIDSDFPRKWLLVKNEMRLPLDEDGSKLLSADHLFLDQDGIPTIVEVKRSTDTRIRREVVSQMLDYAANAVLFLSIEEIRANIYSLYDGKNEEDVFEEIFESDVNPSEYWHNVKINLQAGRIRMLFVADKIPRELKTIVEFLNEQMDPAEVLAIEVKQYVGEGLKTLVPRVIGQTTEAEIKKQKTKGKTNETVFLNDLDKYGKLFFNKFLYFASENDLLIKWGTVGFSANVKINNTVIKILEGYPSQSKSGQCVIIMFKHISEKVNQGTSINTYYENQVKFIADPTSGGQYKLNINKNIDENEIYKFLKALSEVIVEIRENGLI